MPITRLPGSFRDPAGHVFLVDGVVHRRIEPGGISPYRRLMDSGLYAALVRDGLLVSHEDLGAVSMAPGAATAIRPVQIPMVSYPYEWCVSQLRDAAMTTLRAQRTALRFGMTLKDASAYNVQFLDGRPVLIDTLSFEPSNGGPWVAYRQFCQHFLAPLLLATSRDPRLSRMAELFMDGVPLGIASGLLPKTSYLKPAALFHIHLHAAADERWAARPVAGADAQSSSSRPRHQGNQMALLDSLERAVRNARWRASSRWSTYYSEGESYSPEGFSEKAEVVVRWLGAVRPTVVWDIGSNTGHFSKAAASAGAAVVALDADPACVEMLYSEVRTRKLARLLPLMVNLASPSPAIGWANRERMALEERGPADLVLALAIVHHLAIGNNVPLPAIAEYLARLGRRAIVEFVPKSDPMLQQMLAGRHGIVADYDEEAFRHACAERFHIDEQQNARASNRTLYLMTAR